MFSFQWHITNRCSNRCKHCYQTVFDNSDNAELPVCTLKKFADAIIATVNEPVSIDVTGGEPFFFGLDNGDVKNNVFELLKYLAAQKQVCSLGIITNGTILNEKIICELQTLEKLNHIKISLESHDKDVNDRVRGAGNFDVVIRNIKRLTNAELPVIIMTTLGAHNYCDVEKLCELAVTLGARGIMFERYVPIGHNEKFKRNVLSAQNWQSVLCAICNVTAIDPKDIKTLAPYKAFIIDMPTGKLGDECELRGAECCIGRASMALMPDGTVYPCRRVPVAVGRMVYDVDDEKIAANFKNILKKIKEFSNYEELCMSPLRVSK